MNKKGKRPMDVCSNEEMVSVIRQYLQTPPIPHGKSREALQLQDTQEFGENAVSQAHDHTAPGSLPSSRPTREALQLQDTQDFGENAVSQAHDHTKPGSLPSSRPTTPFHENAKSSPSKLADSAYSSSDALKTLAEGLAELERLPPLRQSSSSEEVHSMNQKREPSAEETRSLLSEMTRKYEESRREGLEWKSKFEQSRLQEEQALRMVKRLAECMSTNSNPSGGRPVNDNSTPISKTFPEQEARELLQLDVCLASAKNILDALRAADEESNGAIRYTEGMLSNLQRQQQALLKEVLNAKEIFYDTLSSLNTFELRMLSQLSGSQDQQIRKRPMDAGENYSPRRQDEVLQKVGRQNFPKFDDSPERHDQEQKRLGQTAKVTFSSVPREEISESTADQATRAGQCEGETETALLSRLLYAAKQRIQQLKKSLVSLETEKRSLQQKYLEKEAEAEQLLGDKRQIEGKYDTMLKNYLRDAKNVRAIAQKMLADPPVPDADSQDLDLLKGDRLGLLPKLRNLYREMSRRRTEGASKQMPTADEAQAINAKFLHVIHTLPEPNMENFSEAAIEKLTVALMEATDLCQRYATSIMEWYANNQQESKVVLHELDNIIAVVGGDGADNRHGAELDSRTTKASAPNDIEMQWKHSPDHTVPTASTESPPGLKEGQDGPHTTRFEPSSSAERSAKEEAQPLSAATDDRDCRWSTDPLNHSQDSSEEANWTRSLMTDASGAEQDNDTKDESPESSLVDDQTTMTNGRSRATTADQDFSTGRGPLESETGRGLMGPDTSGASSISPAASSGASTPLRIFESTGRDSENQRLLQSTPEIEELMKSIQKAKKSLGSDGETKATGRKEYNDAVKRLINVMRSEDEGRANMALTGIPNLSKPVDPMVIPDVTRMLTVGSSSAGTPVPNVMSERTGSFGLDEDTQDALTRSLPDIITKKEVFPRPIAETLTLPSSSRRASPVTPRNGVGPLPTLVEDKDEEDDEPARRAARESRILTILGKRPGEKSKGGFFGRLMRVAESKYCRKGTKQKGEMME
ncbi:hypothetical protein DFJ77DRAFT_334251 [Powellomyces hirtus]|nr:hypothetical protein DFJ77DRAFT_334251 [Powellomyces hirtus]